MRGLSIWSDRHKTYTVKLTATKSSSYEYNPFTLHRRQILIVLSLLLVTKVSPVRLLAIDSTQSV